MCKLGEQNYVLNEMKNYWGGMLKLGATTFWEKYNPESTGLDHYSMYGRPFGKSLCHAWGASPVYLLGKYYVGVKPIQPGYKEFEVRPVLGGLQWFDASVPTPHGDIKVFMDKSRIVVTATEGEGNVVFRSATTPKSDSGSIQNIGADEYTLRISGNGQKVTITYKALN